MALYPYVAGDTYEWGPYETSSQRLAVIDRLVAIHGVTNPATADHYMARSGVDIDQAALSLYRIRWELCEISLFTDDCRRSLIDSADMQIAWESLNRYLDPRRRV